MDLLRGLESLDQSGVGDASTMPAYVAEILIYRGLVTRDSNGLLALTTAGLRVLEEHHREGIRFRPG